MNTDRTPLPWRVHPMNPMAVHHPELECWIPRVEADAKFIELACNTHDELVAALRLAETALEQSTPKASHYPEPVQRHADALASVSAALAKVGA